MPRQRERCPKDPELIRLRNRERQQQCRARKRERARRDAAAELGVTLTSLRVETVLPLMANEFHARRQDEAPLCADVCSYPLVHQICIHQTHGAKKEDEKYKYPELFKASKPQRIPNFRASETDGSVLLDFDNRCYGRDSPNVSQSVTKFEDRNIGLDVLAAATKHLTENWEQLCSSENQTIEERTHARHQSAGLQAICPATSVESRTHIRCHRKWKRDARMAEKYKHQAYILSEASANSTVQVEKINTCTSQLSCHDLVISKGAFSSVGNLGPTHQVNQSACKANAASHGRRNWKAAARAGGWDSTITI